MSEEEVLRLRSEARAGLAADRAAFWPGGERASRCAEESRRATTGNAPARSAGSAYLTHRNARHVLPGRALVKRGSAIRHTC